MNLDTLVATVEDDVLPGLSYPFASRRGAAYVREHNFSTFHPATPNTYTILSQRAVRVVLSDNGSSMLDLSTIGVACAIKNTGSRISSSPAAIWPACSRALPSERRA